MACTLQFVTIVIIFGVLSDILQSIYHIEEVNGINITVIMGSSQFILGLLILRMIIRKKEIAEILHNLDKIEYFKPS